MGFVANFIRFPTVQKFENWLIFDKVSESLKVGTFLRHSVIVLLDVVLTCEWRKSLRPC